MVTFRKRKDPYLFDEETGDTINYETGEVASYAEILEWAKDPVEGAIRTSNLEAVSQEISELMDELKFGIKNGMPIREVITPEIIVGETDLSQGAGNEDEIHLAKVENLVTDPDPTLFETLDSIHHFILAIRDMKKGVSYPINTVALKELADIIRMISDHVIPITNTSHVLRIGERIKRILVQSHIKDSEIRELKDRVLNFLKDFEILERKYFAAIGNLRATQSREKAILEEINGVFTRYPFYLKLFREQAESLTKGKNGKSELLKLLYQLKGDKQ